MVNQQSDLFKMFLLPYSITGTSRTEAHLWCFGRVCVPLLSYRSWRFTRFDWCAVHLESFQLTALEAAFVYNATVVQAPWVGAIACWLSCGADETKKKKKTPNEYRMTLNQTLCDLADGQVVVQIPRFPFVFQAKCNTETFPFLDDNSE